MIQEWEPGFEEDTNEPPVECWGCGAGDAESCACEEPCSVCEYLFCTNAEHEQ